MDQYKSGAEVVSIYMQSTNPPKEVRSAFNRVNQAMQNKDKKVNEAMKAYNQEVTEAGGKAREMVQVAEGEATRRVNEAEGEANKFDQVMAAYGRNPEITQQRLYFESMQRVLSRIKDKWVVDKEVSQGSGVNGLLHYNKPLVGGSK
jgi:membrane protease subunit HflK